MLLDINTGILEQVDGSASFSFGPTKVITSVAGPLELTKSKNEIPNSPFIDLNIRPETGVPSTREALLESKVLKVLESVIDVSQYSLKQIQINNQIVEPGEDSRYTVNELAAVINSTFIALLDSGISLKASFLASVCAIDESHKLIVNPNETQLRHSVSQHIVVFSLSDGKCKNLLYSDSKGKFTESEYFQALDNCSSEIEVQIPAVREFLVEKVKRDYVWKL